jgi:hypothetical protein
MVSGENYPAAVMRTIHASASRLNLTDENHRLPNACCSLAARGVAARRLFSCQIKRRRQMRRLQKLLKVSREENAQEYSGCATQACLRGPVVVRPKESGTAAIRCNHRSSEK